MVWVAPAILRFGETNMAAGSPRTGHFGAFFKITPPSTHPGLLARCRPPLKLRALRIFAQVRLFRHPALAAVRMDEEESRRKSESFCQGKLAAFETNRERVEAKATTSRRTTCCSQTTRVAHRWGWSAPQTATFRIRVEIAPATSANVRASSSFLPRMLHE